jgi:hypothetical protein
VRAETLLPRVVTLTFFVGAFFESARAVRHFLKEMAAMRLDRRRDSISVLDLVITSVDMGVDVQCRGKKVVDDT